MSRPELNTSRDDLVPIPDMADVPTQPAAHPHPLKVTIPDINALKKANHPSVDAASVDMKAMPVAESAPITPVVQSSNLSQPSSAPVHVAIPLPAALPTPQPTLTSERKPFPQIPTSPLATVSSDPVVAVAVTTEPEPLPAYATMGSQAAPKNYAAAEAPPAPRHPSEKFHIQQMASVDTERLAALSPAAGADTGSAEMPLISSDTAQPADAPLPALKVPPVTSGPALAETPAPIPTLPTANSQLPATPPPSPAVVDAATVGAQPLLTAKPIPPTPPANPTLAPLPPVQAATPAPPPAPPQVKISDSTPLPPTPVAAATPNVPAAAVRKWDGPDAVQAIPPTPVAENPPPAPAAHPAVTSPPAPVTTPPPAPSMADASEPKRELSPESKKIIDKLPSHPDKKEKIDTKAIDVDHSKDMHAIDKSATIANEKSSPMGIKVDTKAPRMNLDYELERAYNALIAGRSDAAALIYKNVLQNDANNKNALFGLATIYHRAGQLELARPLYAKLLAIDPNNRNGLNNFLVLLSDEAPEDALAQLQKLKDANPTFSPIPAQMAVICQKLGLADQASANMTRAIELEPENLTYRYNFAIMLDKQHKYDEAAQLYRQIIQAYQRGEMTPGNIQKIQQRLTFISSNRP